MKPLLSLLLALFGAVCCLGAQLSTDTLPSPATIDSLQARIDRLERRADRWDRLRSRLPEFSGYVQLGYEYDGNTSSFLIRRAQFALAGSLLPSLHYNVRLEFASPQILDACLDYRPLQALNLRVGEFKVPFSIENTAYPPTKIEFIHYPMALLRLMGFADLCGLSSTGRDMGLVSTAPSFRATATTCCITTWVCSTARGSTRGTATVRRISSRAFRCIRCRD